jgi:ADP-ribose pyrophosphatase
MDMWKKQSKKIIANNGLVSAELHTVELPSGKIIDDYLYIKPKDGALVVATTNRQELILLEHYKYAINRTILTLPGGLADTAKENLLETARRELFEETGYTTEKFHKLGFFYPMPGNINQKTEVFFANGCEIAEGKASLDETEFIKVKLIPLRELKIFLLSGKITDGMSLAALYLYINSNLNKNG